MVSADCCCWRPCCSTWTGRRCRSSRPRFFWNTRSAMSSMACSTPASAKPSRRSILLWLSRRSAAEPALALSGGGGGLVVRRFRHRLRRDDRHLLRTLLCPDPRRLAPRRANASRCVSRIHGVPRGARFFRIGPLAMRAGHDAAHHGTQRPVARQQHPAKRCGHRRHRHADHRARHVHRRSRGGWRPPLSSSAVSVSSGACRGS